jgi:CSLREA domain-containing protein
LVLLLGHGPRPVLGTIAASSYAVNSTDDLPDVDPGDGRCETAHGNGICTLRAAIMEANASTGPDVITVPPGTYRLTRRADPDDEFAVVGDLDITNDLTITGAGTAETVIDGDAASRIFDMAPFITVVLSNMTLRNGVDGDGGAIRNAATLTLDDVIITSNTARASGGGILNTGFLRVTGGRISDNHAGRGGAITNTNAGSVSLTGVTVQGNTAWRYGGGLTNDPGGTMSLTAVELKQNTGGFCCGGAGNGGTLTVSRSAITGNHAEFGGGLTTNHRSATTTLMDSTVSDNSADDGGGGLVNEGTLIATNITISGNTAGQNGGGLYSGVYDDAPASATITNATFTANTARSGGAIFNDPRASVQIRNSILAGSPGGNCAGPIGSLGHNLDDGTTCGFQAAGDRSRVDPRLGPTVAALGPAQSFDLLPDSPAIDAADPNGCPAADQRGVRRPQGAGCDIGAVEHTASSPPDSFWADRPPAAGSTGGACPQPRQWLLVYWAGSDGTTIASAVSGCPSSDAAWVNREGRWLGYAPAAPQGSDTWTLNHGEAHFLHGK